MSKKETGLDVGSNDVSIDVKVDPDEFSLVKETKVLVTLMAQNTELLSETLT